MERTAITPTNVIPFDNAALSFFSLAARPLYRFSLQLEVLTRQQVESLSAIHATLQGGQSFYWDGGPFGAIDNFSLIGEGDGARRDFFLANRNVGAGSLSVQTLRPSTGVTSAWASSGYTLNANAGLVTFNVGASTTPASGDDVMAKWGCRYRCHFAPDGLKVTNRRRGIYSVDLDLIETAYTG